MKKVIAGLIVGLMGLVSIAVGVTVTIGDGTGATKQCTADFVKSITNEVILNNAPDCLWGPGTPPVPTPTPTPAPIPPPALSCSDNLSVGYDRGCQTWYPTDARVTIQNPAHNSTRNYAPGCSNNPDTENWNTCYQSGSIAADEVYAMRIAYKNSLGSGRKQFVIANGAGDGSEYALFNALISETPGDTYLTRATGACQTTTSSGTIYIGDSVTLDPFYAGHTCMLDIGKVYYLNFWPQPGGESARCSTPGFDCRVLIDNSAHGSTILDVDSMTSDLFPSTL